MGQKDKYKINNLKEKAKEVRKMILYMLYKCKGPHIGSSFSIVEILVALYFKGLSISPKKYQDKNRDRFILSKGHACPALYATLFLRGFISKKVLDGFSVDGGTLEQHPTRNHRWGIEVSTGSLGHGLSIGAGMAVAGKADKRKYRVFVLLGDGEINEGSIWEAAMFASHNKLDNLIAIIDLNKIQALGNTEEVINMEPLAEKWRSFGWAVREIDGHNFKDILNVLEKIPFQRKKPSVIIANTTKGKGVSFMENDLLWHYRCPDEGEYKRALKEILK